MFKGELIGNLGADALLQSGNDGKFVTFRVAHSVKYTDRATGQIVNNTTWVSCTWNHDGGGLLQYLKMGAKVFVRGSISSRLYTGNDGQKHAGINMSVQEIELCGGRVEANAESVKAWLDANPNQHDAVKQYIESIKSF